MIELLGFIFVLGLLVFVHEFGHFAVAKLCGIRVEKFSLGFPPKMIGRKIGETEYCLSWVPLGGYVKMAGEQPIETEVRGEPYEFMSKKVWQRSLVILAGPAMNYVLTFAILIGIFFFKGEAVIDDTRAVIGEVVENSPAERAGLMSKDILIAVDDQSATNFTEIAQIISKKPGETVKLTWLRGDDTLFAATTIQSDTNLSMQGDVQVTGRIGIWTDYTYAPLGVGGAIVAGFQRTNEYAGMIFTFIADVISGSASSKLIGGPLFIAQAAGRAAREGILSILVLAAILSVNLCVVNLVPIPVLDGGQLLFLAIEKIKGNPVSLRTRAIMQQIGLVCLLALIIFVTRNDIWRIQMFGW